MSLSKIACRRHVALRTSLLIFGYHLLLLDCPWPTWADSWQQRAPVPGARAAHSAVWTGREMIIWGGRPNFFPYDHLGDGARYEPATDTWRPISTQGAPTRRSQCLAVWTGSEMVIWGGETDGGVPLADGARYNPALDTWTPMLSPSGLEPRMEPTGVWTGSELIVFGGVDATTPGWTSYGNGARYYPATGLWQPTTSIYAPRRRMFWRPDLGIWTGAGMFVCAGSDSPASLDSTHLYTLVDPPCPPVVREQPQSVTAIAGSPVDLAVGVQPCLPGPYPTATVESPGPIPLSFDFDTGASSGQLQFEY